MSVCCNIFPFALGTLRFQHIRLTVMCVGFPPASRVESVQLFSIADTRPNLVVGSEVEDANRRFVRFGLEHIRLSGCTVSDWG